MGPYKCERGDVFHSECPHVRPSLLSAGYQRASRADAYITGADDKGGGDISRAMTELCVRILLG